MHNFVYQIEHEPIPEKERSTYYHLPDWFRFAISDWAEDLTGDRRKAAIDSLVGHFGDNCTENADQLIFFHYEFELIHPFADGNGRLGRLWHTLLLSQWNPAFAWLPVESMIYAHQEEYYAAINFSNDAAESTVFVEFMLSTIKASLTDALCMRDEMSAARPDKSAIRWQIITQFLQSHDYIMNGDVQEMFGVSSATANRILTGLEKDGKLIRCRVNGHWAYRQGNL